MNKQHAHDPESIDGLRSRIQAFRAMAASALNMNSSESVRLKRYRQKMDRANELQKRLDAALRAEEANHA